MNLKYSVLMSVYYKEKPFFLKESVDSMINQTVKPDEIVLVKDGKLTPELDEVISSYEKIDFFRIIDLKENVGLGKALSIGLGECRNEFVARMDTDDISDPNRCEEQLKLFYQNSNLSIVGTGVAEFIDTPENIISFKEVKETDIEIKKFMKYRNPMNHPSVMFKKCDVIDAGNYQHWHLNEDYYLWLRMMEKGYHFQNINLPLVKMRINNDTYLRRGGWNYFIAQKKMFDYMFNNNIINFLDYSYSVSIRLIVRVFVPNQLRKWIYLNLLRSIPNKTSSEV